MNRCFLLLAGLVCFSAMGLSTACEEKDESKEIASRELANRFHQSLINGNVKDIMQIVDVPFILKSKKNGLFRSEDSLEKAIKKNLPSMRRTIVAATRLEVVSYEDYLKGEPIAGKSHDNEESAIKSAKKVGFSPGGMLVRLYFRGDDGRQDGRHYFLVMQPNSVGDLKITSYF